MWRDREWLCYDADTDGIVISAESGAVSVFFDVHQGQREAGAASDMSKELVLDFSAGFPLGTPTEVGHRFSLTWWGYGSRTCAAIDGRCGGRVVAADARGVRVLDF